MRLEARGITVSAAGCTLVRGAGLSVAPGELVGLIGPNGAGKSTLLRAILGLRGRDAGTVLLGGDDHGALTPRARARRVAYLPQDRRVEWRLTVEQIVMLGRYPHRAGFGGPTPVCRAAAEKALTMVDAGALRDRPFAVLSGGERTRVLLARALAVEAPLLLADEPIAALDPYHQLHVMEILQSLAHGGAGVLAVIHDLSLAARFMDRLVLMDRGEVVAEGGAEAILSSDLARQVYGIEMLSGARDGRPWLVPWTRAPGPGRAPGSGP